MKRSLTLVALSLMVVLTVAIPAHAEEAPAAERAEAAMMAAMTPGEHHQHLEKTAGQWETEVKIWMDPSNPEPVINKGTSTFTSILGGRYMQQEFSGSFMGMPFTGYGTTGYDNLAGEYIAIWIDNASTGISMETGQCDGTGTSYTYAGALPDPVSGMHLKTRTTHNIQGDTMTLVSWATPPGGGDEFKMMEISYTRIKP